MLLVLFLTEMTPLLRAQSTATVAVESVRFGEARDQSDEVWWEAEVNLEVAVRGSGRGRFADRVSVTLNLATEATEAEGGFEFYRARATAVAVEDGRASFRFYLPPAVVRRDRLRGPFRYWVVDLEQAGLAVPLARTQIGSGFAGPAALHSFRQKVLSEAEANDGVLVPQYLSPFAYLGGARSSPAMIRPEALLSGSVNSTGKQP